MTFEGAAAQGLPGVCIAGGAILPEGDEGAIRTLSNLGRGYDYLTNYCYAYGNKIDTGGPRTTQGTHRHA